MNRGLSENYFITVSSSAKSYLGPQRQKKRSTLNYSAAPIDQTC